MKRNFALIPLIAGLCLASAAQAITVSRTSGNTPLTTDFSLPFKNHPNQVGYNNSVPDRMFLETFQMRCAQGQRPVKVQFSIDLLKLTQGPNRADNDGFAFWSGGTPLFSTHIWTAAEPTNTSKTLSYNLDTPLPAVGSTPFGGNVLFNSGAAIGPSNPGHISFSVQDDTMVRRATLQYECIGRVGDTGGNPVVITTGGVTPVGNTSGVQRKGMTLGKYTQDAITGVAAVGCQPYGNPGPNCDAYQGDTFCAEKRPVLCINKNAAFTKPAHLGLLVDAQHGWASGVIATSPAVAGSAFANAIDASNYCKAEFGAGWRVAEFHDGTGWNFTAYGDSGPQRSNGSPAQKLEERFWVHIKDQPNANCWGNPGAY
jgi:hypothetical protein